MGKDGGGEGRVGGREEEDTRARAIKLRGLGGKMTEWRQKMGDDYWLRVGWEREAGRERRGPW